MAPDKPKENILNPMRQISESIAERNDARRLGAARLRSTDIAVGGSAVGQLQSQGQWEQSRGRRFAPAGQSTQMIIGATPEHDLQIIRLSEAMYGKYRLKRVFYSAYIPVQERAGLPALNTPPPVLREHRLYQADWLLRFYGFAAQELLDDDDPNFSSAVDPKCQWALRHMELFPVEINTAPLELLLRVPGLGVTGCKRIINARRTRRLDFTDLPKMRIALKRCQYFITCKEKVIDGLKLNPDAIMRGLMSEAAVKRSYLPDAEQLSLFDKAEFQKSLTGQL
jgi:predicted DNA-binding helix-hairpin-helix protein